MGEKKAVDLGKAMIGFALGYSHGDPIIYEFVIRRVWGGTDFDLLQTAEELGMEERTARYALKRLDQRLHESAQKSLMCGLTQEDWVCKTSDN